MYFWTIYSDQGKTWSEKHQTIHPDRQGKYNNHPRRKSNKEERPWQPGQRTKWEFSTKRSTNAGCRFFWSLPTAQSTIWSPRTRTRQEWPDGSKTATTRWRSTPAISKTRWSWWDFSSIRPRKRIKELPAQKETAPGRLHRTVSDCIVPILLFFFLKTYKNIGF